MAPSDPIGAPAQASGGGSCRMAVVSGHCCHTGGMETSRLQVSATQLGDKALEDILNQAGKVACDCARLHFALLSTSFASKDSDLKLQIQSIQANPADPSVIAFQGMRPCLPPIGKAWLHLAPDHQLLEGSPKHPRVIVLRGSAAARQGTFARSRMGSWAIAAGGRW